MLITIMLPSRNAPTLPRVSWGAPQGGPGPLGAGGHAVLGPVLHVWGQAARYTDSARRSFTLVRNTRSTLMMFP